MSRKMMLNMGPQHPSTHGVLRVILELEGENTVGSEMEIGLLHRGIEKMAESMTYSQFIPVTDRLDYVTSITNNLCYVMAVEKLLGIEITERCKYARTLLAELQRIASHLLFVGIYAMDLGAITPVFQTFRDREIVLDLLEMITGARLTYSYFRVGGVREEIPDDFFAKAKDFNDKLPGFIEEYETLLTRNRIFVARNRGVGVITKETAIEYGLTGPILRATGVDYDIRKAKPYAAYDKVDFDVAVGEHGDCYDRYLVRIKELKESQKIVTQCLNRMPDGPINCEDYAKYKVPKPFKPPVGEAYVSIENPKGELGMYVISDGTKNPYRLKINGPSFINLASLNKVIKGCLLADVVAILASLDIVLGEIDK
ncbi:NADH-quinone oxidoreductase subunit D [Thermodesulfobacteriota bacterium]